jgi:hypothetical protein
MELKTCDFLQVSGLQTSNMIPSWVRFKAALWITCSRDHGKPRQTADLGLRDREAMKLLVLALLVTFCGAQELPDAPHKFLDRQNVILFSMNAGLIAADAFTTDGIVNDHRNGQEFNPIARPFVEHTSSAKATIFWASTYVGTIGLSYLFHRTEHHRLERFTQYLLLGCETYSVTANAITDSSAGP